MVKNFWYFLAIWIGLILSFGYIFDKLIEARYQSNIISAEVITNIEDQTFDPKQYTVISQNRAKQYITFGKINDKQVIFLLDTGASEVVIPGHLAKKLNVTKMQAARAQTAAGKITVFRTKINKLQIGNIILENITASINPKMSAKHVLLGMSALRKIDFMQRNDKLILIPRD